ncbi:MAG: flagellar protein FliT, partial [Lachnospiraceae bacterium]|nr:flagellar protein FliT [Lachnospiraceae bacterium]
MEYSVDYIQVLIDSLRKKSVVLDRISELNEEQKQLAAVGKVDLEEFQKTLEGKQDCIDELNKLDEGFELVYERVKPELVD